MSVPSGSKPQRCGLSLILSLERLKRDQYYSSTWENYLSEAEQSVRTYSIFEAQSKNSRLERNDVRDREGPKYGQIPKALGMCYEIPCV